MRNVADPEGQDGVHFCGDRKGLVAKDDALDVVEEKGLVALGFGPDHEHSTNGQYFGIQPMVLLVKKCWCPFSSTVPMVKGIMVAGTVIVCLLDSSAKMNWFNGKVIWPSPTTNPSLRQNMFSLSSTMYCG